MNIIHWCHKIIEYSFYALFFLVPLVFVGSTSELFELNKMWVTFGITVIIMTAWVTKMIVTKQFRVQKTPLDIFFGLFFISQFLSTLLSLDSRISLWGYYSRFNGGLLSIISYLLLYYAFVSNYFPIQDTRKGNPSNRSVGVRASLFAGGLLVPFLAILLFSGKPESATTATEVLLFLSLIASCFLFVMSSAAGFLKRLLFITIISGLLVGLWGLPSHFGSDPTCYVFRGTFDVSCWTDAFKPTIRTFSTLGQPAWLAAYMAVLTPLTVALFTKEVFWERKNYLLATGYFVLTGLFYLSLLYANTRAGFIGFWVGNALFWAGIFITKLLPRKQLAVAFSVITGLFITCNFFAGTPFEQLNTFTYRSFTAKQQTTTSTPSTTSQQTAPAAENINITDSGNIRLHVWKGAINAWKANPLFGTGVETFAFAYYQHRPEAHNLTSEWDYLYNKAHNEYLNYLTTTGILGLGTYCAFILWFIFKTAQKVITERNITNDVSEKSFENYLLIFGMVGGFISILISNFLGFSVVIVNLFLFLIPAFVFVLHAVIKEKLAYLYPKEQNEIAELSASQWVGLIVVAMLSLYSLLALARFWNADKAYALGSNLARSGEYNTAYTKLQEAVAMRGAEPIFKDELSITSAQIALLLYQEQEATGAAQFAQQAVDLNNQVLESHPNSIVFWKSRVRLFYTLGQIDPQYLSFALQAADQAAVLAPTDAKILYNLGVLYGQNNKSEKAVEVLEKTVKLKPDYEDAWFALALFYRDLAVNENDVVTDQAMQQKATDTMNHILSAINPNNEQVKNTLKEWNQ